MLKKKIAPLTPPLLPAFNFAAYVDKSTTLQKLIQLGVNLHKLEKRKNMEFLLSLDFENDIKKYITLLCDIGVSLENIGEYLTKNPHILQEDIEVLQARIGYLQSKKFSPTMISKVIGKNPYWLMFSVEQIDQRLGYFQTNFKLTGKEVRQLAIVQPRLITYKFETIRINTFALKEEMGFNSTEVQKLLLKRPKLWMIDQNKLNKRFSFVHNEIGIPHETIVQIPEVLYCRESRLRERHAFLVKLNRAQYDPQKENYVSLKELVAGNDTDFCMNVAKSTPAVYNAFLKTL